MLRRRCRLEAGKAQPKHERHTDQEHKLRCGQLVRCRGRSARHRAAWCRGSGNHDGLILGRPGGSWAATCLLLGSSCEARIARPAAAS
jgi:hypothetical protein